MKFAAHDLTQAILELSRAQPDPERFLREIRDELSRQVRQKEKTIHVTIATPSGDAGELLKAVEDMLAKKFNTSVDIQERADPRLIGGVVITFDDEQIDMSVRGALRKAADAFAAHLPSAHS